MNKRVLNSDSAPDVIESKPFPPQKRYCIAKFEGAKGYYVVYVDSNPDRETSLHIANNFHSWVTSRTYY